MNAQNYREDRTSLELNELLHHFFYIPFSHGITQKYIAENYPGWTHQQLERVLRTAGVRVGTSGPPVCHPDVVRMQFDSERSWRVEWKDGSVTEGPEPAGTTQPAPDSDIKGQLREALADQDAERSGTPEQGDRASSTPPRATPQSDGWPADEHPIFIDSGFGHVQPSAPRIDGLGERRRLTAGATVRSDAAPDDFAKAWTTALAEKPERAERWEYSVEESRPGDDRRVADTLDLEQALERVRLTPGARLRRRAVGRWQIAPTPFPSFEKPGWAELESDKRAWHAAMYEFPPSYRNSISRMGGIDAAPTEWIEFARRAAAVGFSPSSYRMLGTAHLAWKARQAEPGRGRHHEIPALQAIELWALFPGLIDEGASPLEAIGRILNRL